MQSPRRRFPVWLPLVGAFLGLAILAVRLATVPLDPTSPLLTIIILGVMGVVVAFTVRAMVRRARLRDARAAYPAAVIIPIAVGVDTSAATRWLATHLPDPAFALRPDRQAVAVLDADGLRLLEGGRTSAAVPAERISVLPASTARLGLRQVAALVLGVAVDGIVAPVPLVPTRADSFAAAPLGDAELFDLAATVRQFLAGDAEPPRR
jgi:hypothetical protein